MMLPKGLLKEYSRALSMIMRVMDMIMIAMAGGLAYLLRFGNLSLSEAYLWAVLTGTAISPFIFSFFDIYESVRGASFLNYMMRFFQVIAAFALLLAGIAFLTKSGNDYSRLWFLLWMIAAALFIIGFRITLLIVLRFMRSHGLNERRVVIFGAGSLGGKLTETIQQALWTGFHLLAIIDDAADQKQPLLHRIPVLQTPDNLNDFLLKKGVDELWIALPLHAQTRVKSILHELRHQTITTRFVLDIFSMDLLNHSITEVAGFPVLNIQSSPMKGINRLLKAIEDRVLAALILMIISPLFLLLACLVKWSSQGPIFFEQKRLGWDGKIINVYKFRTMVVHKEKEGQLTQATAQDKRITRVGRWLRRTSLDELPQFINVLQGRMSIVGPRPHALYHNEQYKDTIHVYMQRHQMKPGITGWAQVNGWRGETDTLSKMQKRVEYDLYYINNWSLAFDLKIIFLTLFKGFFNRNAY